MNNIINKLKMMDNKKLMFIVGIVLVVGITLFIVLNRNNIFKNNSKKVVLDDGEKVVEKIAVDSKINEITVVDSRIEKVGKVSNIFIKIKNNTNNVIDKSDLKLNILDKDNKVILVSYIYNVEKFNVGDEREVQVATNNELSDANKYVVEKVESK